MVQIPHRFERRKSIYIVGEYHVLTLLDVLLPSRTNLAYSTAI